MKYWIFLQWSLWSLCISKIFPLEVDPNINTTHTPHGKWFLINKIGRRDRDKYPLCSIKKKKSLRIPTCITAELKITNQRSKLHYPKRHTTNRCSSFIPKYFNFLISICFKDTCFSVSTTFSFMLSVLFQYLLVWERFIKILEIN